MPSELSDEDIALMSDIAQNSPITMTPRKQSNLDRLVAENFIAHKAPEGLAGEFAYSLTPKGQKKLDDLGVGANES